MHFIRNFIQNRNTHISRKQRNEEPINSNITSIQNTINNVSQYSRGNQYTFIEKDAVGVSQNSGIVISNKVLLSQFKNCTNIVYFQNFHNYKSCKNT